VHEAYYYDLLVCEAEKAIQSPVAACLSTDL